MPKEGSKILVDGKTSALSFLKFFLTEGCNPGMEEAKVNLGTRICHHSTEMASL